MSLGKTRLLASISFIQLAPYLVVMATATHRFGVLGAAAAYSVRLMVDATVTLTLARRHLGAPVSIFRQGWAPYAAGCLILGVPAVVFVQQQTPAVFLAAGTALALCAYGLILWRHVLDPDERRWIGAIFCRHAIP
jgi:O-antigen/teichoic acid export membrane protein